MASFNVHMPLRVASASNLILLRVIYTRNLRVLSLYPNKNQQKVLSYNQQRRYKKMHCNTDPFIVCVYSRYFHHYDNVIMNSMASQITSLIYLLNRLFGHRSKKTSKLRVTGLCAGNSPGPVNFPHKGPVTRKMFPFDDVIMYADA